MIPKSINQSPGTGLSRKPSQIEMDAAGNAWGDRKRKHKKLLKSRQTVSANNESNGFGGNAVSRNGHESTGTATMEAYLPI